ncbi:type II secretion system protein [Lacticaseibacillus camelliae]
MRRAFTLIEVILALAIFIIMSAASLGVGRAILVHEREEQFF